MTTKRARCRFSIHFKLVSMTHYRLNAKKLEGEISGGSASGAEGFMSDDSTQAPCPENVAGNSAALAPTIFHESWWLDIATGGAWDVVEHIEDGKVVGRLPFFPRRTFGLSIIKPAPLTNFLGPAIDDGDGKPNKKFLRRLEITQALIAQLPRTDSLYIKCHRDVQDVVAFQGAGFRASVQFTNEIQPAPIAQLWDSIRNKVRASIRGASKEYVVEDGRDAGAFMDFYRRNIENRQLRNQMDLDVCTRLIDAALQRGRGRILQSVHRETGQIDAAIFYVWDSVSAYFLLTTHQPAASHRGVVKILIWDAIKDAANRGLIFDFDGISSTGCARSANDFTATLVPRYIVVRESGLMRILRAVQSLWVERNWFY